MATAAEALVRENFPAAQGRIQRVPAFDASKRYSEPAGMIGISQSLRDIQTEMTRVAPTNATVLITGESGTGKELVACGIHQQSPRSAGPFVRLNCAAIPTSLLASELFGHERGSFTGADQRRVGRFESAHGGTIFLDEIGEIPAETQVALLRVLQEREIERVGGNRSIPVDVRVIAATNRNLRAAAFSGQFRLDLYYRLNVFPIHLPALRERREDLPALVDHFINVYARKLGRSVRAVAPQTMELLDEYAWPGNIRELQNVIERAIILTEGEVLHIDEKWLPPSSADANRPTSPVDALVKQEKELVEAALRSSRGRVSGPSGAALKLGIPASTLESKIRSLGIDKYRLVSAARS